ncbi:carboxylesterase [Hydrogenovibrio sp. 3SP14C1]|uniref:alpha/beta hydrolase n=1 Tax=Hydrogenovibrio sp. 3SP14C1 TaxID=3038774 RepID=UPI00241664E8|nr:alpha/beta fold hydrolase [Hydrogenovibrio sp. 3SP14C1]MDG4812651.1 carboxylesterase [Hydrogenovibrio sp. 3SP14C1]
MDSMLPPIVLEPETKADACVIWLHGLGADGHDFENIVPELQLPADHTIRFVFPTAGKMPVTVNLGSEMTAWYDIRSLDLLNDVDWEGVDNSVQFVHTLIESQISSGIESDRIILAGFSQGGMIILNAGLTFEEPLAGMMALSTYFPEPRGTGAFFLQPKSCPVFMAHGMNDPVCPFVAAEQSRQTLIGLGLQPQWHTYPMQHQVCLEEIKDMGSFIRHCLMIE